MTAIHLLDAGDPYQAGACNIGPAEIARRRRSGIVGLSVAAVLAIALVVASAEPLLRLTVAAPLFAGILGIVQARMRFCVGYAMGGLRNLGPLGARERVADAADRESDRRRALEVALGVAVLSGAIAVVFALSPI